MRWLVLFAVSGCIFARGGLIRESVAKLYPACNVDGAGNVDWSEIDPWLYRGRACKQPFWCRERDGSVKCQRTRLLTKSEWKMARAVALLRCPEEQISSSHLDPETGDPLRVKWWWGVEEYVGCGRAAWCGDSDQNEAREQTLICSYPDDFETAAAQLAVETQCPATQLLPEARQVFTARFWHPPPRGETVGRVDLQVTWRISACGRSYVCTVSGGLVASVACKAALDQ